MKTRKYIWKGLKEGKERGNDIVISNFLNRVFKILEASDKITSFVHISLCCHFKYLQCILSNISRFNRKDYPMAFYALLN